MADLLTILFQTALAATALSILIAMARESLLAREPRVGRRQRRTTPATAGPIRRPGRVPTQRRLGY